MFSRGNSEKNKEDSPIVDELTIDSSLDAIPTSDALPTNLEEIEIDDLENEEDEEQQAIVKLVEKISGILSPYFVVIVGLYLYDDNFFFGSIFILIGMLSLLKISYQDIWQAFNKVKDLLTQDDTID